MFQPPIQVGACNLVTAHAQICIDVFFDSCQSPASSEVGGRTHADLAVELHCLAAPCAATTPHPLLLWLVPPSQEVCRQCLGCTDRRLPGGAERSCTTPHGPCSTWAAPCAHAPHADASRLQAPAAAASTLAARHPGPRTPSSPKALSNAGCPPKKLGPCAGQGPSGAGGCCSRRGARPRQRGSLRCVPGQAQVCPELCLGAAAAVLGCR